MTMPSNPHPFSVLNPDSVILAVESQGFISDGRILALNSYENRVYQVGIEDDEPVIIKFYRPERWTQAQIQEEHSFTVELKEADFPVVCPLNDGHSLFSHEGLFTTIFPRRGGRAPELDNLDNLYQLGQYMGRLHAVGKISNFKYRPSLTIESFGRESQQTLLTTLLPKDLHEAYRTLTDDLLMIIEQRFAALDQIHMLRCHGDCHIGNILWRDDKPHFVDFDDARMAPAIQDLWMFLSGNRQEQQLQIQELIEGYEMFNAFNPAELSLIEPLRTLRLMHFSAWLAKRWHDPAFPMHFPWFNTAQYWGQHILELREQLSLMQESPLQLSPYV